MAPPLQAPAGTLVLGIGNALRGDDGAGAAVLAQLAPHQGVQLRTVHQLLPELAADLATAARVVFVDASVAVRAVTVAWLRAGPAATAGRPATAHRMDPQGLIDLTMAVYGRAPLAAQVAVPGVAFAAEGLSVEAAAAVQVAVARVEGLLAGPARG